MKRMISLAASLMLSAAVLSGCGQDTAPIQSAAPSGAQPSEVNFDLAQLGNPFLGSGSRTSPAPIPRSPSTTRQTVPSTTRWLAFRPTRAA